MAKKRRRKPLPQYLSVAQAAVELDVTRQRVQVLVRAGRLKATKVGETYIIESASVLAYAATERKSGRPKLPTG